MVNRNVNQAEVKQRFSLRKLKIGTVSVLLGATFFLLGGNGSVKADTANPGSATVQSNWFNRTWAIMAKSRATRR